MGITNQTMEAIQCCKGVRSPKSAKSAPSMMGKGGARAQLSSEDWLRKCNAVQVAHVSPEFMAQAQKKADRLAKMSKMSRKADKLRKCNMMSQRAWNSEMALQSSEEVRSLAAPERCMRMKESATRASMRMEVVQRAAAESDSDEDELDCMGAEMGLAPSVAPAALEMEEEAGQMEMSELLEQLKVEPAEEEEQQAKFLLFEKYLETVEKLRGETFEFWAEAKEEFHESGRGDVERALRKIDGHDNLGVDFFEGRWFVYDMTKKAGSNCAMIGRNLAMIKTRIELLAQQDDCPVCLEPLEECGEEPHVFSCCHKVCGECWQHWSELHRGGAFCPMCRQEDFLGDIIRRASALGEE